MNHTLSRYITLVRARKADFLALLALIALPIFWFFPVLFTPLTHQTLLPFDNLSGFQPWANFQNVSIPHNELLSDLVLQNTVWKHFIRQTISVGQLPLWNPQLFTGQPFLASGQASTFYPLNVLFYTLPLELAYGWFTALQISIAGINMYLLGRVLRLQPLAALYSGIVYMFSGFLIVSVVFTMFIAAVPWLPLLLAIIEHIIRKQESKGNRRFHPTPYVLGGAVVIGVMVLAGHPELIYYTLLVAGAYTAVRLLWSWRIIGSMRLLNLSAWLLGIVVLGIGLGGVQLIPLLELLPLNFREGSASYEEVVGWAWPSRHVLTFFIPDIFGNPSHHHWYDLWQERWEPASFNALGERTRTIFWGIKNYVEGGNYLGILTWLLAGIAVLGTAWEQFQTRDTSISTVTTRPLVVWFCVILALLSLLFAFGTPLYALLFYGLPGWNQLHSPFRWVFPFTLSMAILSGVGLQLLSRSITKSLMTRTTSWLALLVSVAGLAVIAIVFVSMATPTPFIQFSQRVVDGSDLAQMIFSGGHMFWGYQSLNLLKLGIFTLLSGVGVWLYVRSRLYDSHEGSNQHWSLVVGIGLLVLLCVDLYAAHGRFNPSTDSRLSPLNPDNYPPVVNFLNQYDPSPTLSETESGGEPLSLWRFTTFNLPGEKTFNANTGMYYGWHDIRGYDSIIPRQYVQLLNRIAPQENELLYNRIAPLYANVQAYEILNNPLLDLMNVKYVLTEHFIPNPEWTEIYRDNSIGIYENQTVIQRAFIVPEARIANVDEQPLEEANLKEVVFLDAQVRDMTSNDLATELGDALRRASPEIADVQISRYTANDVFLDVNLSDRGWLVLTDAYFPGWKAYVRPFGGQQNEETELQIYRANGAFRAVYLPDDGQWTVRFVYTPMSFKLGLYVSFLAFMTLMLLMLYWGWGKYYRPTQSDESFAGEVRTVAKNSVVPMVLNLVNKATDFAFAMLYVRLLGPEGTGKYYFVVALYGIFEIISRYGLGTLLTRDVAADKNQSSRYLTNVIALRTLLWLVTMPVLALVTIGYRNIDSFASRFAFLVGGGDAGVTSIGMAEIQAIALLGAAMLFANWADALSSCFYAFEKMEYPAGLANAVSLLKVTFGALVLLLGWGFVGLAGVSLVINMVQVVWLYNLLRGTLFKPQWHWDWGLQKWMVATSGPLMINHLLATIFWRIDVWILFPLAGAASVGLYSVGLKYLDGLNIFPSLFTMAIFPLLSRYANKKETGEDGEADTLLSSYIAGLRLLVILSLPIAMVVTVLAEPLVLLVGGALYLNVPETVTLFGRQITYMGGAALALQVIIWSIPIGFVNSITQFVLIAVNQQRYLTKAFIIGVVFNTVGNLLVIPQFGYLGAAVVTIASEFSLLFPFYYSVRRHVGIVPWVSVFISPVLSIAAMGGSIYWLQSVGVVSLMAVIIGGIVYVGALMVTGAFRHSELEPLREVIPYRLS
ncbi:MAG: polysaccharide biosynthesis C-terminal domain-containing protein [Chloroflexota bacterium]